MFHRNPYGKRIIRRHYYSNIAHKRNQNPSLEIEVPDTKIFLQQDDRGKLEEYVIEIGSGDISIFPINICTQIKHEEKGKWDRGRNLKNTHLITTVYEAIM